MFWNVLFRVNTIKNNNPVWYNKCHINLKNRKTNNINLKNSYLIIAKPFDVLNKYLFSFS